MAKKAVSDEAGGTDDIRKTLEELAAGTKEQAAWQSHGEGKMSRETFRNLWLEIRVPKKTPQKPNEGVKA